MKLNRRQPLIHIRNIRLKKCLLNTQNFGPIETSAIYISRGEDDVGGKKDWKSKTASMFHTGWGTNTSVGGILAAMSNLDK